MKKNLMRAAIAVAAIFALPGFSRAGGDHDHGDNHAPSDIPTQPRFATQSELFDLVGVLEGRQLTLYLDQADTNAPIKQARIELDIDGAKLSAEEGSDGLFRVMMPSRPQAELISITATITAGDDMDLLAAELDLHDQAHAAQTHGTSRWRQMLPASIALLALLAGAILLGKRLRTALRRGNGRVS